MNTPTFITLTCLTFAAATAAGQTATAPHDSTTTSSIAWKGKRQEPIFRSERGGLYLARTNKGRYYRYFIHEEQQPQP